MARKYRRLIRYAGRQWRLLAVIIGLSAVASAVTALQPWPVKLLVDHALAGAALPRSLAALLDGWGQRATPAALILAAALCSLALFALHSALDVALSWSWTVTGKRLVYELSTDLFRRLQRLSLSFHSRRTVGDSLSRLAGDTWCVYTVTESLLVSPGQQALTLVTLGTVAWSLDPALAVLSLGMALVLAVTGILFGRRLKRRARRSREVQARLLSFVHQTLGAVPVVQAFGAEGRNDREFRRVAADAVAVSQRGSLLRGAHGLVSGLTTTTGIAVVLFVGGQRVLTGTLTVGSLLVLLAYLRSMQAAWQGLVAAYADLKGVEASIERVLEILDEEEEAREAPGARPLRPGPAGERGHVRLEGVTFGYERGRMVLEEVTLEARPGETVALVGPTGAGKSTLAALIPRFFDPWGGRVLLDGADLRDVKLSSLRAQVALVFQEPFILPLTVAENIAYGRPGASRAEIIAAAEAANADEFIRKLPEGYHTVLAERGATLSGGERQRLAIARALLKEASVLILDEPTSALDAETEALLLEALERLKQGRTTFIIAHRLSTVKRADRVVVLEGGRVVEMGPPDALLASGGSYHRFHALQLHGSSRGAPP